MPDLAFLILGMRAFSKWPTIRPGANSTWQLGGQTLLREYPITLPNEWTGECFNAPDLGPDP